MILICQQSLTPEDLPLIEKEMKKIINENIEIERKEVSREEAIQIYKEIDDEYKLELIEAIPEDEKYQFMNKVISLTFAVVFMCHQQVK